MTHNSQRATAWSFTVYEPQWATFRALTASADVKKMSWNDETCPTTGRRHYQACVWTRQLTFKQACALVPGAHVEPARDVHKLARYVSKADTRTPGTEPQQATGGLLPVDDILMRLARVWEQNAVAYNVEHDRRRQALGPGATAAASARAGRSMYDWLVAHIVRADPKAVSYYVPHNSVARMTWLSSDLWAVYKQRAMAERIVAADDEHVAIDVEDNSGGVDPTPDDEDDRWSVDTRVAIERAQRWEPPVSPPGAPMAPRSPIGAAAMLRTPRPYVWAGDEGYGPYVGIV